MTRKKPTRKQLTTKADRLFSEAVRARDGRCVECGSSDRLQCAHGFSRRYRHTRWDFRNAWALCSRCHVRYTHNPALWNLWLEDRWDRELYVEIRTLALQTGKMDLAAIVADLLERPEIQTTESDATPTA